MKIVVCPDSFKGSLSSREAAECITKGLLAVAPQSEVVIVPVADGGEGTLDAIVPEENRRAKLVRGPLGVPVSALYGATGDGAIIEMSRAAGLTLMDAGERDPLMASTFGVGELIKAALDEGVRSILLTVGGSGTNDGGTGMLEALGAVFYDKSGAILPGCGRTLSEMARMDLTNLDNRLFDCDFTIACDVTNPLIGPNGATRVYGPQKGADAAMQAQLETGMENYVHILRRDFGADVADIPGCGAGGGISAPLLAFAKARIVSGIDAVLKSVQFERVLEGVDLVITGEGKTDVQSLYGKAVSGIARAAFRQGVPTFVFCGTIGEGCEGLYDIGVRGIYSIVEGPCSLEDAMKNAPQLLYRLAYRFAKTHL